MTGSDEDKRFDYALTTVEHRASCRNALRCFSSFDNPRGWYTYPQIMTKWLDNFKTERDLENDFTNTSRNMISVWNALAVEHNFGVKTHATALEADGCTSTKRHRVCDKPGNTRKPGHKRGRCLRLYRIEPRLAQIVFGHLPCVPPASKPLVPLKSVVKQPVKRVQNFQRKGNKPSRLTSKVMEQIIDATKRETKPHQKETFLEAEAEPDSVKRQPHEPEVPSGHRTKRFKGVTDFHEEMLQPLPSFDLSRLASLPAAPLPSFPIVEEDHKDLMKAEDQPPSSYANLEFDDTDLNSLLRFDFGIEMNCDLAGLGTYESSDMNHEHHVTDLGTLDPPTIETNEYQQRYEQAHEQTHPTAITDIDVGQIDWDALFSMGPNDLPEVPTELDLGNRVLSLEEIELIFADSTAITSSTSTNEWCPTVEVSDAVTQELSSEDIRLLLSSLDETPSF